MEAIVNKQINNKNFQLRAAFGQCTDEGRQKHLYRYRFEPEHEKELRTICHEKNITLVEISKKNLNTFKAFEV
jgi:hypothetical protein